MYDDLRGRTALVTGAGQGIGRAVALALAAEGVDVAVNVRQSRDRAEETAMAARALGVKASVHVVDVADRPGVFSMVEDVVAEHGGIDILVNNAGSASPRGSSFEALDHDLWQAHAGVVIGGTVNCCQAVGRHLVAQRSGAVVNITSVASVRTLPFWGGYSVTKGAVASLTRTLAMEWLDPEGSTIRVNAIAPGPIATPRTERLRANEDLMVERLRGIPMRRVGQAEEIADVVLFLVSDRSGFMTGQELVVDGGEADFWPEMARWGHG